MKATFFTLLTFAGIHLIAKETVQITFDPANDWDPHWVPDGDYFCFTSNRTGSQEICEMKAFGDSATQPNFDNAGSIISSGLYFCRIQIDGKDQYCTKIQLIKN